MLVRLISLALRLALLLGALVQLAQRLPLRLRQQQLLLARAVALENALPREQVVVVLHPSALSRG